MKNVSKVVFMCLVVLILFVAVSPASGAETIRERIQSTQEEDGTSELEDSIDDSASSFVSAARRIGVMLTIIFGIYLAFVYLTAGFSPDILRNTKGRIFLFLVFLAFCFFTEQIIGFVFGLLGIDLTTL